MSRSEIIQRNENILGGTPVFAGTRVPIQNLFDYLKKGYTISQFLDDFPAVTREQVAGIFDFVREEFLPAYENSPR